MTQKQRAQKGHAKLARYRSADSRSLAGRRAAFAAQMREMALSDLKQVSERLKGLHREFETKDGRRWAHYDLAREMGIKPRTFQSWENGEVENRNGKGYDKMARFYSRKLGRKITRQWIVFGDGADAPALPKPDSSAPPLPESAERRLEDQIAALRGELLSELGEVRSELEGLRSQKAPGGRKRGSTGS